MQLWGLIIGLICLVSGYWLGAGWGEHSGCLRPPGKRLRAEGGARSGSRTRKSV
jgi:hypothetical protein